MPSRDRFIFVIFLLMPAVSCGCYSHRRANPSFTISREQARVALRMMQDDPRSLKRPLVILGGFADLGFGSARATSLCRRVFNDDRVLVVNFIGCTSFAQCRAKVIRAVNAAFPPDDQNATAEVDIIGLSMGGLVARVAADLDVPGEPRLRIARLFTVSSPLRGAKLARYPLVLTSMHRDLREGSRLIARLNASPPAYPIYAYTHLHDPIVGEELAAPAGERPWWLDGPPLLDSHYGAMNDERILADIARRLRGEEPFAQEPRAPLPPPRS
jgi:hypothetical protein